MNKLIFTIGIVFTLGVAAFGQKESTSVSTAGQGNADVRLNSGIAIEGQLQKTLDVQKARVGDQVIVKTTRAVKDGKRTIVPKGSRLVGRITDVQQRTKSNNSSRLGLVFDRLEGNNLNADLTAAVVTITNIAAAGAVNDSADLFGSSNTSATSSGSASGGGLLGGTRSAGGGLLGAVTNRVGNTVNSSVQTVGGVTGAVDQTVNSSTSGVFRTVNGLQISNSANSSAEAGTTLSAMGKNLKVEKGAIVRLQMAGEVKGQ